MPSATAASTSSSSPPAVFPTGGEELKPKPEILGHIVKRTMELAYELTGFLGRRVQVVLTSDGLGFTVPQRREEDGQVVVVHVNPIVFFEEHPEAEEIFRALGYHEAGHQKYDSDGQARVIAKSFAENFKWVTNIVLDEWLERKIRSEREDVGRGLQILANWVLNKSDRPSDRNNDWIRDFRLHLKPEDPVVAKAIEVVPRKLTKLGTWEVLDLSREINKILKEESKDKDKSEDKSDGQGEGDPSDAKPSDDSTPDDPQGDPESSQPQSTDDSPQPEVFGSVLDINSLPDWAKKALKEILAAVMKAAAMSSFNDSPEEDFSRITKVVRVDKNVDFHAKAATIAKAEIVRIRRSLAQLGIVPQELTDQIAGHDLVEDVEKLVIDSDPNVFINLVDVQYADLDIQLIVDCSGSMSEKSRQLARKGIDIQKHSIAKTFGVLTAEAIKGIPGCSNHFWGFTDEEIYDASRANNCCISGLPIRGGNNDAAALYHAANHSKRSGKTHKVLVMVSDGLPTECTWGALNGLVAKLEKQGFICVQVAVDRIPKPAFKRFVDLSNDPMSIALRKFGQLIEKLIVSRIG